MNALALVQLIQSVNQLVIDLRKADLTLGSPDLTDAEIAAKLDLNIEAMEALRDNDEEGRILP